MHMQHGVIGAGPQFPSKFPEDEEPAFYGHQKFILEDPTDQSVEGAVGVFYGELGPKVRNIVDMVVTELFHNAQGHRSHQQGVYHPWPEITVTLGWTLDGDFKYPLVIVQDRNIGRPELRVDRPQRGLVRVISHSPKSGWRRSNNGNRVWAMVDFQPR
ncbi:hypothetical protein [Actinomadura sp. NPDC049753]|uniref:hypothetical protein n=1 Tax=Actinomadura sp. NPDC049753 TaxID=3154739 RepID=UPI0034491FB9